MFEKIKKVIKKIYREEEKKTKNELKNIMEFVGVEYARDCYKKKNGDTVCFFEKLTTNQHKKTIKQQIEILQTKILNKKQKELSKNIEFLETLEKTKPAQKIELSIKWTKGGTYGHQASAVCWVDDGEHWEKIEGGRTSGCGYDKRSTASAQVFNKSKQIFVLIAKKLEKMPQKQIFEFLTRAKNGRAFLGYGFDFWGGVVGSFSGGVGFECHAENLKNLGFKTVASHYSEYEDFFVFEV